MEIKFTASIAKAIQCAIRLTSGRLTILSKGADILNDRARLPLEYPSWCSFDFFGKLKASPIRRNPHGKKTGLWDLERQVEFFHFGHRLLVIDLIGKSDGSGRENEAFWAVRKIGYFVLDGHGPSTPPTQWKEYEVEITNPNCFLSFF